MSHGLHAPAGHHFPSSADHHLSPNCEVQLQFCFVFLLALEKGGSMQVFFWDTSANVV